MTSIKYQRFIYHLTDIENLPSILQNGLQPRSALTNFSNVADPEILTSRALHGLDNYVPFHFFARSPFDGAVQLTYRHITFVLIAIDRNFAQASNWSIIPKHPLSLETIELLNYVDGIRAIDWDAMDKRDYKDPHSHSVCMAECLSPSTVSSNSFVSIYVKDNVSYERVNAMLQAANISCYVNINAYMFV